MNTRVEAQSYGGSASAFDDSRFINYSSLSGFGEVKLTISEVLKLEKGFKFENGHTLAKDTLALRFEGKEKVLRLNATNRRTLAKELGNKTSAWVDKEVMLYGDPTVKFAGKEVGGVKVKEAKS